MTVKRQEAQNPLILRCHRLIEAFAKANDEREFYLNRLEGFIIYVDLDKTEEELTALQAEIDASSHIYSQIPKLTFYETKKIMESFVNEKVYDIDTKEKLLDIIQSREARENFLEFVYDHHAEFEKWQLFYQERSRIRIIEWLRQQHLQFVFEEDLDLTKSLIEKLKINLFQPKVNKEIAATRKLLSLKAKVYYSNEALNPRPKRGRPPKQAAKPECEPQMTGDIYLTVSATLRPFLFTPDFTHSTAFTFSSKFENEEQLLASRKQLRGERAVSVNEFQNKLASLRSLSTNWVNPISPPIEEAKQEAPPLELQTNETPVAPKKKAKEKESARKITPSKTPEKKISKGRPKGSTKKKRIIPSS